MKETIIKNTSYKLHVQLSFSIRKIRGKKKKKKECKNYKIICNFYIIDASVYSNSRINLKIEISIISVSEGGKKLKRKIPSPPPLSLYSSSIPGWRKIAAPEAIFMI